MWFGAHSTKQQEKWLEGKDGTKLGGFCASLYFMLWLGKVSGGSQPEKSDQKLNNSLDVRRMK